MHNELTTDGYKKELRASRILVTELLKFSQEADVCLAADTVESREGIVALQGLLNAIKGVNAWAKSLEENKP